MPLYLMYSLRVPTRARARTHTHLLSGVLSPQEMSDGKYRMGPAFIPWVQSHNITDNDGNYDAAFGTEESNGGV